MSERGAISNSQGQAAAVVPTSSRIAIIPDGRKEALQIKSEPGSNPEYGSPI